MFKLLKRILSLALCISFLLVNNVLADTVVIGAAPGTGSSNKTVSQNANTTFLQNQYTGPGLLPNSASTGTTPIQGVSFDNSAGQRATLVDSNNVSDTGPTVKIITSPAANNAEMSALTNNSKVIANSAIYSGNNNTSTVDEGPVTAAAITPGADGPNNYSSFGSIINGQTVNSNSPGGGGSSTTTSATTVGEYINQIPAYYTEANSNVGAPQSSSGSSGGSGETIIYQVNNNIQAVKPVIQAPAAIVLNATTRQIYFSKGGFDKYHPASLVNLVTASILLNSKGLDDPLIVTQTAVTGLESGATTAKLKAGDVITVRDAIGAMFVKSCCDVANVVAENVAGSVPAFVAIMNQTAKNWGCVGTTFTNPSGLNNDAQLTNTYDMAIIMDKASANPALKLMLQQAAYTLPATAHRGALALKTSNQLLTPGNKNYYAGIGAARMGYTSKTKYTISAEIDYNGSRLIAVVLKANGSQYTDITKLLNFAKVASLEGAARGQTYTTTNNTAVSNTAINTAVNAGSVGITAATVATGQGDTEGTWLYDNNGWYFVKPNGQRAMNEWIKQGGKMYCIDSTGYMITGWKQMSNGKMYYFDANSGEFRYGTWVNVSTGAYYLQADGSLAKADYGTTKNIVTNVGTYTIDDTGKAIAKVS